MGDSQAVAVVGRVKHEKPADWVAPTHVDGKAVCGAWARQRGGACVKPPGWGTDHPGQGKCRYHGGSTPSIHGRYSTIVKDEFARALEHVQSSGDPLDVLPELAFLRAILTRWIQQHAESFSQAQTGDHLADMAVATRLIDQIGKAVGRVERIRSLNALSLQEAQALIRKLAAVVERVVADPDKLAEISGEWQELLKDLQGRKMDTNEQARAAFAASDEPEA